MNSFHVYSQIEFFTAIYSQRYFEINYKVFISYRGSCTKIKFERVIFNSIKKKSICIVFFRHVTKIVPPVKGRSIDRNVLYLFLRLYVTIVSTQLLLEELLKIIK